MLDSTFNLNALGPVTMNEMAVAKFIEPDLLKRGCQFRLCLLMKPMNEFVYAHLVQKFYTGNITQSTSDIESFNLVDVVYKRQKAAYTLQGVIPNALATMLLSFVSSGNPESPKPDVASMRLMQVGERCNLVS